MLAAVAANSNGARAPSPDRLTPTAAYSGIITASDGRFHLQTSNKRSQPRAMFVIMSRSFAAMTHPGVGPITALAFVLIVGYPERFRCGKQIGSYVGLIPQEASSGVHRRLGHISKQGSSLLRFLLVEAAQAAARFNPEWRSMFLHLAMRRERRIAKVAMARKLAVNLYWMWRKQKSFQPSVEVGSYAG